MHVEMYQRVEDIPLDSETWNSLVEKNVTNTIFQTYEWFHAWWDIYKYKSNLVFLVLKDSSNVIKGFAPFMLWNEGIGRKSLRFVGDINSDYCDFVINGDRSLAIKMLLDYVFTNKVKWTSILLQNIPEHSSTRQCIETICKLKNYKIHLKPPVLAPSLKLKSNPDDIKGSLNRYSISRHYNKLKRAGKIEYKNLYDYDDIYPYIEDFFNQHIKRYNDKNNISQFVDSNSREYFYNLLSVLCKKKHIIFSVLKLNDTPIAYHLGFEYKDNILWYKPTFNIDYKMYSPGTILLKYLILHGIENSLEEVDFGIGGEVYKERFCNVMRYNDNIAIYQNNIMHIMYLARQKAGDIYKKLSYIIKK